MNNKRKILFLVDHKHRDLPSLSLISYYLSRMGCDCSLAALGSEKKIIIDFDPKFIVMPKPIYNLGSLIKWKLEGRSIIVIDSEGNPQDLAYKMNIRVAPSLYCFWNDNIKERYKTELEGRGTLRKVIGYYRSDFLHKSFRELFPARENLLVKYKLDPRKRTITFATSTQDSHFSEDRIKNKYKRRNKSLSETANYHDIVDNMRKLRTVTENMIRVIANKYPDLNVIIKPHPNENSVHWSDFIHNLNKKNICMMVGEPINHLLIVSDLHIAHNVCTTTIESLLFGLPTVEIHTDISKHLYSQEHLNMADYLVSKPEDIERVIEHVFFQDKGVILNDLKNKSNIDNYVNKYFYKFDGKRCFEYAKQLNRFMLDDVILITGISLFYKEPKLLFLFFAIKVRDFLLSGKRLFHKSKNITDEHEINRPSLNNKRDVRVINKVVVDREYGLFDNRMKPGDEKYWYRKYDTCKVINSLLSSGNY
jgi:surface carbohydrate biosynthesis protein